MLPVNKAARFVFEDTSAGRRASFCSDCMRTLLLNGFVAKKGLRRKHPDLYLLVLIPARLKDALFQLPPMRGHEGPTVC